MCNISLSNMYQRFNRLADFHAVLCKGPLLNVFEQP
jgi:hypothetical protein